MRILCLVTVSSFLFLFSNCTTTVHIHTEPQLDYETFYNGKFVGRTPCKFTVKNSSLFPWTSKNDDIIRFSKNGRIINSTTLEEEYKWRNICLFGCLYGLGLSIGRGPIGKQVFIVDPIKKTVFFKGSDIKLYEESKRADYIVVGMSIAVMDFRAKGVSVQIAENISELIRAELINMHSCTVIERSQMGLILKEQGFQETGCTNITCAVKVGKLLSAHKILIGTVMKIGEKIIISGRIVDVENGTGERAANQSTDSIEKIDILAKKFIKNLIE